MRHIRNPLYWLTAAIFAVVWWMPAIIWMGVVIALCMFTASLLILATKALYWAFGV